MNRHRLAALLASACAAASVSAQVAVTGDVTTTNSTPVSSPSWDLSSETLFVGNTGTGSLTISDDTGNVSTSAVIIGNEAGSVGTVTVSGGSLINSGSTIRVGSSGSQGTLTVSGTGLVQTASQIDMGSSGTINLNGGTLALGSSVGEVVGALTLSANSTLDMNTAGDAWISFASLTSVLTNTTRLEVWNYTPGSDHIYFLDSTNLASSLDYISFYSGAGSGTFYNALNTSSFSAPEVHATIVPEPGVYLTAAILLIGMGIFMLRRQISLPDTSPANQQIPSPDTIPTPMVNK
jgi:T5SS/PEP-CTERM-associated repeat protein